MVMEEEELLAAEERGYKFNLDGYSGTMEERDGDDDASELRRENKFNFLSR